jgi:subtilisin family serine protease
LLLAGGIGASAQEKIPVKNADELPRHTYKLPGTASELLKSDEQFAALAKELRANTEAELAKYQIDDKPTLRGLYLVLVNLDVLDGRFDAAAKGIDRVRDLEDKESKKLMTGLVLRAYIAAREKAGEDEAKLRTLFKEGLLEKLRPLPWDVVGDEVEQRKGQTEMLTSELMMGSIQAMLDPVVAKTAGEISGDLAQRLISVRLALKIMIPLKDEIVAAFQTIIDAHRVAKKDIWAERAVTLQADQKLTPVLVGVWDSGVDPNVFEKLLFTNSKDPVNGKDDDNNGYIDDAHGIAFDLDANPTPDLLHPLTDLKSDVAEMTRHMKGFMDMQSAVDSPEASEVKKVMAALKADQVKAFIEDLGLFGNYIHGTHVAGIALDGNPAARLLIARLTFEYHVIPMCPTMEWVQQTAAMYRKTTEYFKQHEVRVVNMSWGEDRKTIEAGLEKNGKGEDAEKRAAMAREMFKVMRTGLLEAIQGAPDVLFISAAGNSDNDVEFDEMIPSGFDLPNLLVVGAVNQAGEPTNFTSFGRTVQVYANGFEVDSYIPGGKRLKLSGTSMASPNVVNLAAKLLALDSSLKPAQVIELIKRGADKVEGKKPLLLINPKKTVGLVQK